MPSLLAVLLLSTHTSLQDSVRSKHSSGFGRRGYGLCLGAERRRATQASTIQSSYKGVRTGLTDQAGPKMGHKKDVS